LHEPLPLSLYFVWSRVCVSFSLIFRSVCSF
jgi:hypothetical protein